MMRTEGQLWELMKQLAPEFDAYDLAERLDRSSLLERRPRDPGDLHDMLVKGDLLPLIGSTGYFRLVLWLDYSD